jgi:hypothetical protein
MARAEISPVHFFFPGRIQISAPEGPVMNTLMANAPVLKKTPDRKNQ